MISRDLPEFPSYAVNECKHPLSTIVLLAGFPDSETSGWGSIVPNELAKHHRLIFLCFPGFNFKSEQNPWGYSFPDLVDGLYYTLQKLGIISDKNPEVADKFDFIVHDWGSFLGMLFQRKYPNFINSMVILDVGLLKKPSIKSLVVILMYQLWFAFAYFISQLLSYDLGQFLFRLYANNLVMRSIGPCPRDPQTIPIEEAKVSKCYPYYHFWRSIFTGKPVSPRFPSCPILFMYGKNKTAMFHDNDFLYRLDTTPGCRHKGIAHAGHWLAITAADEVIKEMKVFLNHEHVHK